MYYVFSLIVHYVLGIEKCFLCKYIAVCKYKILVLFLTHPECWKPIFRICIELDMCCRKLQLLEKKIREREKMIIFFIHQSSIYIHDKDDENFWEFSPRNQSNHPNQLGYPVTWGRVYPTSVTELNGSFPSRCFYCSSIFFLQ